MLMKHCVFRGSDLALPLAHRFASAALSASPWDVAVVPGEEVAVKWNQSLIDSEMMLARADRALAASGRKKHCSGG